MGRGGKSNENGMHSIHLHAPTIHVKDDAHPFERRPRGEVGALKCVRCELSPKAPVHQLARSEPWKGTGRKFKNACSDCGKPCDARSRRCQPCSTARIHAQSAREHAIAEAKRNA